VTVQVGAENKELKRIWQ